MCPCSLRQIQRKAKEYREGDRVSCERKTGSGRPRTVRSEDIVEAVRTMIEEDNTVSLQYLSSELDLHESTCLLYTSPSPRDGLLSRMPSSA